MKRQGRLQFIQFPREYRFNQWCRYRLLSGLITGFHGFHQMQHDLQRRATVQVVLFFDKQCNLPLALLCKFLQFTLTALACKYPCFSSTHLLRVSVSEPSPCTLLASGYSVIHETSRCYIHSASNCNFPLRTQDSEKVKIRYFCLKLSIKAFRDSFLHWINPTSFGPLRQC